MKVQRKHNGVGSVQFEVVEETPKFYILHGLCLGEYVAVSKADYEPVQEWVIVPIENIAMDTRGYNGLKGNCNSYFFVDKYGNYITSDHEPIIIDGKVGLRRRKQ